MTIIRFMASMVLVMPAWVLAEPDPEFDEPPHAQEAVHAGHGAGPVIDAARLPARGKGVADERIRPTPESPAPSHVGAFRTACGFSHMAFDDPIVFPGSPGKSHLHVFFGNTGTDAFSTADSLAHSGNSTCRGGTANRSAYWVPAMIDTRTGAPVEPRQGNFYYKSGYKGIEPSAIKPMPIGLRMIAGDPRNSGPSGPFSFNCKGGKNSMAIPNCPVGNDLYQNIHFPQCWDGVRLDSSDHKSHMAYPAKGGCPSTHPVALPEVSFRIIYKVTEANAPLHWRLSSDAYDPTQPAGYSSHGDWFDAWKEDISDAWAKNCVAASKDCHSHLLGDGRKTMF